MKLLLAQPYINLRGGAESVILKIAQHYNAPIYALEYNPATSFPEFKDVEIKIVGKEVPFAKMLPYRAAQGLTYGYNYYNLKIKEDYDVINAHVSPSEWIRHNNERVLWYCHTPPREVYDLYQTRMKHRSYKQKLLYSSMTKMYKLISGRVVKKIENIAVNSTTTQERVKKYYERESTIINPAVDLDDFSNAGDNKYFLYPSRILVNKRQDYVINAFKQFVAKSKKKNYSLVLAGTLSKDPEHLEYYNKIKKLAHGLDVKFKTNLSDKELSKLYSESTGVLFASQNEDFGIVPIEAMASSKPIISVNEGGPRETIVDGKTGFLINSEKEMANKMMDLVQDKSIAEEMGKEGRKRVEENYTWDIFFKKFDKVLEKTAAKR